jgi:hypothetical protein
MLLPIYIDLGLMRIIGFWGENSITYVAQIPVSLTLFVPVFIFAFFSVKKLFNTYYIIQYFLILLGLVVLMNFAFTLSFPKSLQIILLSFYVVIFIFSPLIKVNDLKYIILIPCIFFVMHLISLVSGFENYYLTVNHEVFMHKVFSSFFGLLIYSRLVVYSSGLALAAIFFLVVIRYALINLNTFSKIYRIFSYTGFLSVILLGLASGRKLFLIFIILLFVYFIFSRRNYITLVKDRVFHLVFTVFLIFITFNYQIFIPSFRRISSHASNDMMDSSRIIKAESFVHNFS